LPEGLSQGKFPIIASGIEPVTFWPLSAIPQLNATAHHCSSGQAISITHSEWVFVALGIQHAMKLRHIVTCSLSSSKIFSHII